MTSKLSDWDASEFLEDDANVQVLLNSALREGDAEEISAALGDLARSIGMSEIAKRAGLTREQLYAAVNRYPRDRAPLIAIVESLGGVSEDAARHDAAE